MPGFDVGTVPASSAPVVPAPDAGEDPERPVRAPAELPVASPLRAVAGAFVAVAGVALAIGALLAVTGDQDGSPAVLATGSAVGDVPVSDVPVSDVPVGDVPVGELPADEVPADDLPAVAAEVPAVGEATQPVTTAPAAVPAPAAAAPAAQAPSVPAPSVPAPRPPVTVLNNSTVPGLAARAAATFEREGWPVRDTGNFTGRLRATTVYFEPGQRAAAERFAATFRGIARVLPRPENIPGPRGLTVVLTRDYAA